MFRRFKNLLKKIKDMFEGKKTKVVLICTVNKGESPHVHIYLNINKAEDYIKFWKSQYSWESFTMKSEYGVLTRYNCVLLRSHMSVDELEL